MPSHIHEIVTAQTPEALVERLRAEPGVVLLGSGQFDAHQGLYSLVGARPFLTFRSFGSRCEITLHAPRTARHVQYGNPWQVLDSLVSRFELPDEPDFPFPLGGCVGWWGYDLKNFVEPKLTRRAVNDLGLPDCHVGFYDSLVVFDHHFGKSWIVSTGLDADGSCSEARASEALTFWRTVMSAADDGGTASPLAVVSEPPAEEPGARLEAPRVQSNFSRADFLARVERALAYIRTGDIYQVNLSQRLTAKLRCRGDGCKEPHEEPTASAWRDARRRDKTGWEFFARLAAVSLAPFAAYLDCGDCQIASSSPELFLRFSGRHMLTRPIKGTRPRAADTTRDAQLAYELQTSPKELAELVMITDLLRNDLGKVCEFGSVQVPELARLERFAHVQHLVSTVEGRLRDGQTHLAALAACFPGGSITGAPKFRAMEIIDELEPLARGPYTGCHGYLGFNQESQLSITIRSAICLGPMVHFHVGAGIVADSVPAAEYDETLAKAGGFLDALRVAARQGERAEKCH